uniref:RRM domain-containing protein n=1 Tax=Timspurckia oligopyrenoides TaxID=708627 RepID=A0A7S1EPW2_9RHOD|mmetsp:Transcript_10527/g.18996  ORF Transcript_10527/g.18996 Transcript_10527/m.18996 type:complete len:498 (+) Transcript_10527:131-1624(+)
MEGDGKGSSVVHAGTVEDLAAPQQNQFASSENPEGVKVFVGGLSWETSEDVLRDYFERFGKVLDALVMRDRTTGKPRGFGFVTFASEDTARIVSAEPHQIDGRQVDARFAVPRGNAAQSGQHFETANPLAASGGLDGASTVRGPVPSTAAGGGGPRKIFVGGIPISVEDAGLREYFERFGEVVQAQIMLDHRTNKSRGFGFVTFADAQSVVAVVGAGRQSNMEHEILGRVVEVKIAEPRNRSPPPVRSQQMSSMQPSVPFFGNSMYGNGYPTNSYDPSGVQKPGDPLSAYQNAYYSADRRQQPSGNQYGVANGYSQDAHGSSAAYFNSMMGSGYSLEQYTALLASAGYFGTPADTSGAGATSNLQSTSDAQSQALQYMVQQPRTDGQAKPTDAGATGAQDPFNGLMNPYMYAMMMQGAAASAGTGNQGDYAPERAADRTENGDGREDHNKAASRSKRQRDHDDEDYRKRNRGDEHGSDRYSSRHQDHERSYRRDERR